MEYRFKAVLKSSDKGDIQLVEGDDGRLYVRRYREISQELFRRLQSVSCPFVEQLTEQSADENGAYIISEYIEGTPVSDRTFTEKEAVNALPELCAAISALHKAGIIHRDIKPANLICGNDGHICLIDFDSARLEKTYQSHDTKMLGTAGFAPPEQYGFAQTDCRSDIYSFGVTMREILGDNADKPRFRRIINRCMQFEPEKRFSDIMAVSRAIKRVSHPVFIPYSAVGALTVMLVVFAFCKNSEPAPSETVMLSNTVEAEETLDSNGTVESHETLISTQELPEFGWAEENGEETTELFPEHQTDEELPQNEATVEPIAVGQEHTVEVVDDTTESDEYFTEEAATETAEPTVSIMPEMPFTTTADENGLYRDEFEYVFYDDPTVHGTWRAYKVLPGDTDIGNISGDDIFNADHKNGMLYEFITVYPDGRLAFYQPRPEHIEPTNVWTNGYYISSPSEGGLVCRMRAFTIENGRSFLALEQRPMSVSDDESRHRYIIYSKVDT